LHGVGELVLAGVSTVAFTTGTGGAPIGLHTLPIPITVLLTTLLLDIQVSHQPTVVQRGGRAKICRCGNAGAWRQGWSFGLDFRLPFEMDTWWRIRIVLYSIEVRL
jgi:hypothetical protein